MAALPRVLLVDPDRERSAEVARALGEAAAAVERVADAAAGARALDGRAPALVIAAAPALDSLVDRLGGAAASVRPPIYALASAAELADWREPAATVEIAGLLLAPPPPPAAAFAALLAAAAPGTAAPSATGAGAEADARGAGRPPLAPPALLELVQASLLVARDPAEALDDVLDRLARGFGAMDVIMWGPGEDGWPRRARGPAADTAALIEQAEMSLRCGLPVLTAARTGGAAHGGARTVLAAALGPAEAPVGGVALVADGARRFDRWERDLLASLGRRLSAELTWVSAHTRLLAEHEEMRTSAMLDPLVRVLSRSGFEGAVLSEMKAARRRQEELAYGVLDVVGLRSINAAHGHAAGDRALQHLAALTRDELRANDLVGRIGDDEIGVLLVGADLVSARSTLERILTTLAARPLTTDAGRVPVEVRVGLTPILPDEIAGARAFRRARAALHRADAMEIAIEAPEPDPSDFDDELSDVYDMRALIDTPHATTLGGMVQVLHEISRGAHGVVYRGVDLGLNRPVAIKMLRSDLASDEELVALFRSEAELLAAVHHPNLVQIYSFGSDGGEVYFVMELVEGESLAQLIRRTGGAGDAPEPDALTRLVNEIAGALTTLHRVGVLHRDVKPANILLDRVRDRAVLVDFGVAGRYDTKRYMAGTPGFAAPESLTNRAETPATDVYGLATTLYAYLTGERPFEGGDVDAVLARQLLHPPPPPSRVKRALPAALDRVILRALSPDPQARYATAAEFATAFAESLRPAAAPLQLIAKQVAARVRRAAENRRPPTPAGDAPVLPARASAARGAPRPLPLRAPPRPGSDAPAALTAPHRAPPRQLPLGRPSTAAPGPQEPRTETGTFRLSPQTVWSPNAPARCRGLFFRVASRALRSELGAPWLATVPDPAMRALLDPGLPAMGWHPVEHLVDLLRTAGAALPDAHRLARTLGRAAMTAGLPQILGADPGSLDAGALLAAASSYWPRLFENVLMEVSSSGAAAGGPPPRADLTVRPGSTDPLLCSLVTGALVRIAQLAGAVHVSVEHPTCAARGGGGACRYGVSWRQAAVAQPAS